MITLQNITDSLEVKIGAAIFSGPVVVYCSYQDSTLTRTIPLESTLTIGDVGPNTLVYPPFIYHSRKVLYLSAVNTDSVDADVTFEVSKDGVKSKLCKVTLKPGDKLEYTDGYGFKTLNSDGEVKNSGSGGGGGGAVDSVNGYTGVVVLDKTDIGLSNVPNVDATDPANIIQTSSYRFVTDAEKSTYQTGYNNAAYANGGATTAITFATSKYYGTATAPLSTGSVTYNFTNAVAGSKAIIFHNAGSEPTYPVGTYKEFGTYVPSALNILTFTFIDSNTVLLEIAYSTTAGLQPEVVTWLNKGGVATGFVLTALNQFMLDIASIRSRILRMNLIFGETFASCFIPIIVNDDGSATPLGNALDSNVNYVSSDWVNIGSSGGLYANAASKYINTTFVPSAQSLFGLDDASCGTYTAVQFTPNTPINYFFGLGTILISTNTQTTNVQIALNGANQTVTAGMGKVTVYSRSSSTSFDTYRDGIKTTYTNTSTSKGISALIYGNYNNAGSCISRAIGGYFIGKSLDAVQESVLRGAWGTLMTKLGRQ